MVENRPPLLITTEKRATQIKAERERQHKIVSIFNRLTFITAPKSGRQKIYECPLLYFPEHLMAM